MKKENQILSFDGKKHFLFVKPLGEGGTGDTFLYKDETTDMLFAIKEYSPKDKTCIDEYYKRFVDEIKILFKISHPNVVRIYNYYLIPEEKIGYLQMEYIEGVPIDKYCFQSDISYENAFLDILSAFDYLEKNNILHRDIRPNNILIDKESNVKIIDFGFGKALKQDENNGRSIFLNWPATIFPNEVVQYDVYNHQTEIYFVGKLFQHILKDQLQKFKFKNAINKMIQLNPESRFKTFNEISQYISKNTLEDISFTSQQKKVYKSFVDSLCNTIASFKEELKLTTDINKILNDLDTIVHYNALEENLIHNCDLINSFIENKYMYYKNFNINISTVICFYKLMLSLNARKQKIVIDNIFYRLALIPVKEEDQEDEQ